MHLPSRLIAGVVVAVGLIASPGATASSSSRPHEPSWLDVPPPISAQAFLTQAAAANQFEIVTGQLAQERARSSEIKALGAQFVAHHTELLAQGRAVATQLAITVPETLTPAQQRIVDRLQQRSGKRFDRKWLKAQIKAHRKALALHFRGAIRGELPEIRTLAQGGLPIVAHHYGELLDLVPGHDRHDHGNDHDGHHGWDDDGDHRGRR
jgi:putative membrane protein